jgi:hypothetical protein
VDYDNDSYRRSAAELGQDNSLEYRAAGAEMPNLRLKDSDGCSEARTAREPLTTKIVLYRRTVKVVFFAAPVPESTFQGSTHFFLS